MPARLIQEPKGPGLGLGLLAPNVLCSGLVVETKEARLTMAKIARLVGLFAAALSLGLLSPSLSKAGTSPNTTLVRRIVVFDPSTLEASRVPIAEASGGKVVRELPFINAVAIEMLEAEVQTAEFRLKSRPEVVRVDQDPKINWLKAAETGFAGAAFNDVLPSISPFRRSAASLSVSAPAAPLPWGITRVNAPAAWKVTRGQGAKVCVVDTGIDYKHSDLKVAGGWNAITKTDDFMDDHGHGTHVSGTIAGQGQVLARTTITGVSPEAELYGVKVLDAQGSGTFDDVIAGMQWCVQNKMDVASMSLGADQGNESLKAAVDAMVQGNVVLVAAAGNSGDDGSGGDTVGFPAGYPGAIAVAASDKADAVAYFSSRGKAVAVIAPGVNVLSLAPAGGTATMDGTSMATPHVSGLAALLISAKHLHGYAAVRAALLKAATPLPGAPATQQGKGMIDAAKLVR